MADTGVDIDLYADMESEFPTEEFGNDSLNKSNEEENSERDSKKVDLYDDVLTNNIKDEKGQNQAEIKPISNSQQPQRRYQVYVGNLTWWTTDADINDAVLSVGVNDFIEVCLIYFKRMSILDHFECNKKAILVSF